VELAEATRLDVPDVISIDRRRHRLIGMWKAFAELEAIGSSAASGRAWSRCRRQVVRRWFAPSMMARARTALEDATHRVRHPGSAGDRRFSDPARGAPEQGFSPLR